MLLVLENIYPHWVIINFASDSRQQINKLKRIKKKSLMYNINLQTKIWRWLVKIENAFTCIVLFDLKF